MSIILRVHLLLAFMLASTMAVDAADIEAGARTYRTCLPCHAIDSDTNKLGPHLKGVFGRQAGSVAEFRYSSAMSEAGANGLTWDEAALSEFLSSPASKVPGNRMRFYGLWFQSEIDNVIAYLKATP